MTIKDQIEMLITNAWENLDDKCIRHILREGFEGFDNMSDSDIEEAWKEAFENEEDC